MYALSGIARRCCFYWGAVLPLRRCQHFLHPAAMLGDVLTSRRWLWQPAASALVFVGGGAGADRHHVALTDAADSPAAARDPPIVLTPRYRPAVGRPRAKRASRLDPALLRLREDPGIRCGRLPGGSSCSAWARQGGQPAGFPKCGWRPLGVAAVASSCSWCRCSRHHLLDKRGTPSRALSARPHWRASRPPSCCDIRRMPYPPMRGFAPSAGSRWLLSGGPHLPDRSRRRAGLRLLSVTSRGCCRSTSPPPAFERCGRRRRGRRSRAGRLGVMLAARAWSRAATPSPGSPARRRPLRRSGLRFSAPGCAARRWPTERGALRSTTRMRSTALRCIQTPPPAAALAGPGDRATSAPAALTAWRSLRLAGRLARALTVNPDDYGWYPPRCSRSGRAPRGGALVLFPPVGTLRLTLGPRPERRVTRTPDSRRRAVREAFAAHAAFCRALAQKGVPPSSTV